MTNTILRRPAVEAATGYKRSTLYSRIAGELFTKPVDLGGCVGWPEREIAVLNAARIAGKRDDEIRVLVRHLMAERKAAV